MWIIYIIQARGSEFSLLVPWYRWMKLTATMVLKLAFPWRLGLKNSVIVWVHFYLSLAKEHPWVEHPTISSKRGVGTFSSALHLTTIKCSCHVYSNLMPSKQMIGQTITFNKLTNDFKVKAWCHQSLSTQSYLAITLGEVLHERSYRKCA